MPRTNGAGQKNQNFTGVRSARRDVARRGVQHVSSHDKKVRFGQSRADQRANSSTFSANPRSANSGPGKGVRTAGGRTGSTAYGESVNKSRRTGGRISAAPALAMFAAIGVVATSTSAKGVTLRSTRANSLIPEAKANYLYQQVKAVEEFFSNSSDGVSIN